MWIDPRKGRHGNGYRVYAVKNLDANNKSGVLVGERKARRALNPIYSVFVSVDGWEDGRCSLLQALRESDWRADDLPRRPDVGGATDGGLATIGGGSGGTQEAMPFFFSGR